MLQPTHSWQWQYNQADNQLLLDIDPTMAFTTAYRKKHLTQEIYRDTSFSVEDAHYYQLICAKIQTLTQFSTAKAVQIALNATAAQRYFKPTMPRSWFFKTNQMSAFSEAKEVQFTAGCQCVLYTTEGYGLFMVVDVSENASLCMLLDDELMLNESQSMSQFEIIKVMNDRLYCPLEVEQRKYA